MSILHRVRQEFSVHADYGLVSLFQFSKVSDGFVKSLSMDGY